MKRYELSCYVRQGLCTRVLPNDPLRDGYEVFCEKILESKRTWGTYQRLECLVDAMENTTSSQRRVELETLIGEEIDRFLDEEGVERWDGT